MFYIGYYKMSELTEYYTKNGTNDCPSYQCTYCFKNFSSKTNLNKHLKSAKSCIKNRNENICEYCNKVLSNIYTLERHYETCKSLVIKNKNNKEVENLRIENRDLINKNYIFENNYNELLVRYNKLEKKYEECQKDLKESYKNIQELLINNPKVINTTNNYHSQTNNNLNVKQYVSQLQPITQSDFQNSLQYYTDKYIDEGAIGYAKFLLDHPCNNKIVTTDLSRKVVAYRTDKNEFIKDPKCRELINMAISDNKTDILDLCMKRRISLGRQQIIDNDEVMYDFYRKKINDITEFVIFLKNDLEDCDDTNVPVKISSQITSATPQYNNVKNNILELE